METIKLNNNLSVDNLKTIIVKLNSVKLCFLNILL